MSDQRPSDVLGALPRRRPHRRSDKRAPAAPADGATPAPRARGTRGARPKPKSAPRKAAAQPKPAARAVAAQPKQASTSLTSGQPRATRGRRASPLRQPAQPPGTPPTPPGRRPEQSGGRHILGTAAQAAAELAEIGLSVGTRAIRNAMGRLPRP